MERYRTDERSTPSGTNGYTYLYLVENVREGGRAKQRIIKNLGRKEAVLAAGDLDRLAASVGRHAERAMVLDAIEAGSAEFAPRRIGGPLLFGRLWERTGIAQVLAELLGKRGFEFAVERAVFVATLHRLFVSGSDRDCVSWMADYDIPGADHLALHHFYRAIAWLGEELAEDEQAGATPFAPRTVKDLIEEKLFDKRRDLFTDLSLVFMDTTSLSFYGEGGATLGKRGHSKDHRPDLKQMIVALVIDAKGWPICTEMAPGNTADVAVLVPIIDRQKGETQLFIKEVKVNGERYIVCRNEAEAEKDKAERQAIVSGLEAQLKKGDKALIGNSAYRRYLRTTGRRAFEIDAGKLADEARFDGIFVLCTNARITPLEAVLRYRDLLQVETLFRAAKATFDTRPIYHSSDAAIRGHVFCSFLALVLQKELARACETAGLKPEWQPLLRDLDRLQIATLTKGDKSMTIRTPVAGQVGAVFKAAGVALPPNVQDAAAA